MFQYFLNNLRTQPASDLRYSPIDRELWGHKSIGKPRSHYVLKVLYFVNLSNIRLRVRGWAEFKK